MMTLEMALAAWEDPVSWMALDDYREEQGLPRKWSLMPNLPVTNEWRLKIATMIEKHTGLFSESPSYIIGPMRATADRWSTVNYTYLRGDVRGPAPDLLMHVGVHWLFFQPLDGSSSPSPNRPEGRDASFGPMPGILLCHDHSHPGCLDIHVHPSDVARLCGE